MLNHNQTMQPNQHTSWWFLSAGCLIDKVLDRLEGLSSFVLPAKADNPTDIEARPEELGA